MKHSIAVTIIIAALVEGASVCRPSPVGAMAPDNTKLGKNVLTQNTGTNNTAVGFQAMAPNAQCTGPGTPTACCIAAGKGTCNSGSDNTAVGAAALTSNTTGLGNTAVGSGALVGNTVGSQNTALGYLAMLSNSTGSDNTAVGWGALDHSMAGSDNTAVGFSALSGPTTGGGNSAVGEDTLKSNTSGTDNTAIGTNALLNNTTGWNNVALGVAALYGNTTGSYNIAVGSASYAAAGSNLTTGSNNIDIGNPGAAGESATIRIGDPTLQNRTFIAGIRGVTTGIADGVTVLIDSNGQLGTMSSSRRFKTAIHDMGAASSKLMELRPVTFRYKGAIDPSGTIQYGLIAEEVAAVLPELVAHDKNGNIETVKYQFLDSMLLNEVQKQARQIDSQRKQLADLQEQLTAQARQVKEQTDALAARLVQVEAVVGPQGHVAAVEVGYKPRPGF